MRRMVRVTDPGGYGKANVGISNDKEGFLKNDKLRLDRMDEGQRVTMQALLALLDHNLDGNNIDQMQKAKKDLQKHLIG